MKRGVLSVFAALLAFQSQAVSTLINDDFTGGTVAGWTSNGGTTALTVQNDPSGINTGYAMKYATTGKNNMWSERSFAQPITLGVNDTISLSMDVRFTGDRNSPPAANNSIRWMFMTTANVMTGVGVNPGAAGSQGSWFVVGSTVQESKFASTDLGTAPHHVLLTLIRKDDGAGSYMQYSYTIDGTTFVKNGAVIASPTTEFSFDSIQLGSSAIDDLSGTAGFDGVLYDNIEVETSVKLSGPADLTFTNKFPEAFRAVPSVATNLPVVIRNNGFDASNVTATLTSDSPYFNVLSGSVLTGFIAENGGETTNYFQIVAGTNTPAGTYASAFTLQLQGTGLDGSTNTYTTNIGITVLSTVFSSMNKTGFAADTTGTDSALLTVSNTSAWTLTFSLSAGQLWLNYPAGILSVASGTATNIAITAIGSLTSGQGQYTDTLSVIYLNNASIPNPTNFPLVFDVGPKVSFEGRQAVEQTNLFTGTANGRIEAGEQILLTVTNKNTGAITVSNVISSLSADSAFFTITPAQALYPVLTVGGETATTYQVSISSNTPDGTHTFYVTNRSGATAWTDSFSVEVFNRGLPAVSPASVTMNVLEGTAVTNTQIVVTNSGNAALTFSITDNAEWNTVYTAVQGHSGISGFVEAYETVVLNDPNTGSIYVEAETEGVSTARSIGFGFPLYGTVYSNFYVTADGLIGLVNTTDIPAQSTDRSGLLPAAGGTPLIAPLWGRLKSPSGSIRMIRQHDYLVIAYSNVSNLGFGGGTNLEFQTALFTDGRIEFRYKKISGSLSNQVTTGIQGGSSAYVNLSLILSNGVSVMLTPQQDQWVRYTPNQNVTVAPLSSQIITLIANASGRAAGSGTDFATQFSWSSGGSNFIPVSANVMAAAPVYSAVSSLTFTGNAGQITSVPFIITNSGNGPLTFTISDTISTSATLTVTGTNYNWVDISSAGTDIPLIDPSPSPFITASDEGFSDLLPIGFAFPYIGRSYTRFAASANGALRLDLSGRIPAPGSLLSTASNMPEQMIAPYWGDLLLDENATLKYHSTEERLVITWENVRQYGLGGGSNQSFQAILDRQGNILFQYKHLEGLKWPATEFGFRDVFNGVLRASGFVIRGSNDWTVTNYPISGILYTQYVHSINERAFFIQPAEIQIISYTPRSGTIPAGGLAAITITGDATGQAAGTNSVATNAILTVVHNASGGSNTLAITFTATNSLQTVFVRASAVDDSDGDGLTDDDERIAGTDPQDEVSVFTPKVERTPAGIRLSWDAPPDGPARIYRVYFTTNLMNNWICLDAVTNGTACLDTVNSSAPVIYYKITAE